MTEKSLVMLCHETDEKDLKKTGTAAEWKFDGTRVTVHKQSKVVTLINRYGINYTKRLPEVVEAFQQVEGDFIIDSEAVYINPFGEVEFTPCQS